MQKFKWILQLSRPRFWFYVLGPVLLAIAASYNHEISLFGKGAQSSGYSDWIRLITILLFFTLPANLIIYGINDLFDYETDKHNDKKKSYEVLLEPENRATFLRIFAVITSVALAPLLWVLTMKYSGYSGSWYYSPNTTSLMALAGFLFFGIGYSAPPIRAKTKPFLDALFNILYVFPGLIAFSAFTGRFPPGVVIVAATLWVMAMHAFSAVPDIAADKKANIHTIATVLGREVTIIFCAALYILSAMYTYEFLGFVSAIVGTIYVALMTAAFKSKTDDQLFKIYKFFPYVNVFVGFILFWTIYAVNS